MSTLHITTVSVYEIYIAKSLPDHYAKCTFGNKSKFFSATGQWRRKHYCIFEFYDCPIPLLISLSLDQLEYAASSIFETAATHNVFN